jgi:hypothetical protein
MRIRDGKFGSGINIPDPEHCLLQVKCLDLSRLDPLCTLQDHTGEVGGSLHRNIMDHCGHMLQVRGEVGGSLYRNIMDHCGHMLQVRS